MTYKPIIGTCQRKEGSFSYEGGRSGIFLFMARKRTVRAQAEKVIPASAAPCLRSSSSSSDTATERDCLLRCFLLRTRYFVTTSGDGGVCSSTPKSSSGDPAGESFFGRFLSSVEGGKGVFFARCGAGSVTPVVSPSLPRGTRVFRLCS